MSCILMSVVIHASEYEYGQEWRRGYRGRGEWTKIGGMCASFLNTGNVVIYFGISSYIFKNAI